MDSCWRRPHSSDPRAKSGESLDDRSATGFVFDNFDTTDYRRAVRRAFALYRRRADWSRVRQNGMRIASGWEQSALLYRDLYASLLS